MIAIIRMPQSPSRVSTMRLSLLLYALSFVEGAAVVRTVAKYGDGGGVASMLQATTAKSFLKSDKDCNRLDRIVSFTNLRKLGSPRETIDHPAKQDQRRVPAVHQLPNLSRRRHNFIRSGKAVRQRQGSGIRAAQRIRGGASRSSRNRTGNPDRSKTGTTSVEQLHEHATAQHVLLYYPNLIGYARIALVLASYYLAETNWKASSCFYLSAFAGDAVDGYVARKCNQASRFGAVLDMVTDRCSTAGLLLVLSRLYSRKHAFAFLVLIWIDLFSHWMHTLSVVEKHHKATTTLRRRNILIRTYYSNIPFFAFCCIGTELFYLLLYLLHFTSTSSRAYNALHKGCYLVCLPACLIKQVINIAQVFSAAQALALEGP